MNRPESARIPERARGNRVPTQPFNPLDQFFCALLDISKSGVVVGHERPLFGDPIKGCCALDGIAKPGPAFVFDGETPATRNSSSIEEAVEAEVIVVLGRTESMAPN